MRRIIRNATLINQSQRKIASVITEGERIARIIPQGEALPQEPFDEDIDAEGLLLLPGVIDDHVHFRDPGLTHKADLPTESRAAAAGGVTTYMDMPNTQPQTTTLEALHDKFEYARGRSMVNYSFFFGATNDNTDLLPLLDSHHPQSPAEARHVCGVKLFMGSSTGNMLVDREESLRAVFTGTPHEMILMAHCEDSQIIADNARRLQAIHGEDPDVSLHPQIRSREACLASTRLAIQLAQETGARLHLAHISTADEVALLPPNPLAPDKRITAEACVAHLWFTDADYATLGTRIKCNPAVKSEADRHALRMALRSGRIDLIGTDHAPHLLREKEGGSLRAVSGMPMLQFSLVAMLELAAQGLWPCEDVVTLMCHRPADLFHICERGYIREGYYADLVLVDPHSPWTLTADDVLSKCGWSPLEGTTFSHRVVQTFCNGHCVYRDGVVQEHPAGQPLTFNR